MTPPGAVDASTVTSGWRLPLLAMGAVILSVVFTTPIACGEEVSLGSGPADAGGDFSGAGGVPGIGDVRVDSPVAGTLEVKGTEEVGPIGDIRGGADIQSGDAARD